MASWKKVIVSGSNISQLNNDSSFLVDNTDIAALGSGIVSSSAQLASDISGSLSNSAIQGLGAGIVSSSGQVSDLAGVNNNTITITAGNGISFASGDGAFTLNQSSDETIADIAVDLNELTAKTTIVQADSIAIIDSEDSNASKKITLSNLEDEIFGNVSGDATIAAGGALTIANDAIDLGMLNDGALSVTASGDVAGQAALSADAVQIALTIQSNAVENSMMADDSVDSAEIVDGAIDPVHFSAATKTAISGALSSDAVASLGANIVSGSSLSSTSQGTVILTTNGVAATAVDLGLETSDSPTFANLTVTGDLTVEGSRTELQVDNLNVEDPMILLNSGSTGADTGIIFGGSDGTANNGHAIGWDNSESTFIFAETVSAGDTDWEAGGGSILSKIGEIQTTSGANPTTATMQGVGAINVRTDDETIWIYS